MPLRPKEITRMDIHHLLLEINIKSLFHNILSKRMELSKLNLMLIKRMQLNLKLILKRQA